MRPMLLRTSTIAIVVIFLIQASIAKDIDPLFNMPERSLDDEMWEKRQSLLREASSDELSKLAFGRRFGVGVSAYWELRRRAFTTSNFNFECARLTGYIENRTRREVPTWWSDGLLSSRLVNQYSVVPSFTLEQPASRGKSKYANGSFLLSVDNVSTMTQKLLEREPEASFAVWSGDLWHLAIFRPECPIPFGLYQLNKAGEVKWHRVVWASRTQGCSGIGHFHRVEVIDSVETIMVYGAFNRGFYFECFNKKNGQAIARVCTD